MAPKFGVIVPQGWRLDLAHIPDPVEKFETMTRCAQEAERLGYDSAWVYDHFHTVPIAELETNFECWISTAALARDTSTIRIGQMVTCNNYRNPALLAKMASTVDVLSHGRLDFGIGAGWKDDEYRAYGYDFPDGPTRLKQLDEALQIIHALWRDDYASFTGKFYNIDGAINEPKGVQKPHPPIWIGGSGEQVTLKLVAKHGDACNITAVQPEDFIHKFDVLRGHCEKLGRDYDSIMKTAHIFIYLVEPGQTQEDALAESRATGPDERRAQERFRNTFTGDPAQVTAWLQSLVAVGVDYFVIYFRNNLANLGSYRKFAAEVMPHFKS